MKLNIFQCYVLSSVFLTPLVWADPDTNARMPNWAEEKGLSSRGAQKTESDLGRADPTGLTAPDLSPQTDESVPGTGVVENRRDRERSDAEIKRQVQMRLNGLDTLSKDAQNVTIDVKKGVVTLRGPVLSQAEKDMVAKEAAMVANAKQVKNQLQVVTELNAR